MTILSFFTLNIPIRRLWTNLYDKDHFLKIWSVLHYFSEIYLRICDFALFFLKKNFLPTQNKVVGLQPETLLQNTLQHIFFPVNFVKFLRNLQNTSSTPGTASV